MSTNPSRQELSQILAIGAIHQEQVQKMNDNIARWTNKPGLINPLSCGCKACEIYLAIPEAQELVKQYRDKQEQENGHPK